MASYAAVCSLRRTIQRLLNSSTISILPSSQKILEFAYDEARSLRDYLDRLKGSSGKRVTAMNAQIREAASKLEDAILSHVSDQFLSQTGEQTNARPNKILSIELEEVKQELYSFAEMAKRIMEGNIIEDLLAEEDDDIPLKTDFRGKCSKMVGFSDLFRKIKCMLKYSLWRYRDFMSLVGMAGIGKTTLSMKILEDPDILSQFEHRAFVTIGPKYKLREVMLGILAQLTPDTDEIHSKGVEEVGKYLLKTLRHRRYLIVWDDVWDKSIYELSKYLPNEGNRSWILVTTRIDDVASGSHYIVASRTNYRVPFLNKEESWDLLRERVFAEEYPFHLEKHGKKIAENCEGLPLAIIVVADILSKNEKTPEYWKKTAEKKNSVFTDAYDQMFPILFPSYKYLSQSLKPCFLYMGVFPPGWRITTSKIVKLLSAEGFLGTHSWNYSENLAREHLMGLVSHSLALIHQQSSIFGAKTMSLYSAYWHLCNKLARTEKFFHVINSYLDRISTKDIESQQRLCIHNNILFGIKEVYNLMESILTVRSLLCTSPQHQYPVPLCFGLRFLRVLDALTLRFYKFPIEVLKLVQLRYLALTCNGNVPTSISELWSLEFFFVRRHLTIKPSGAWPYLPMEIWNMKELRHLQVMGSNLPYHCGAMLPNLLTLSNMSADSCTVEILRGTPNLEKLGIQIELPPDSAEPFYFFHNLFHLHKLRSLKCVIVNPKLRRSCGVPSVTAFLFKNLTKLNLSGFGYPWEYTSMIAELRNLEVLKLKHYAFQGPKWKVEGAFVKLKVLLIEETDLVHWVVGSSHFPNLRSLIFRHCYKLKGLPSCIRTLLFLDMIELVDCPLAVDSVKHMQKKFPIKEIRVQCSWDDRKPKS